MFLVIFTSFLFILHVLKEARAKKKDRKKGVSPVGSKERGQGVVYRGGSGVRI
jgi:hypothetical protein